MEQWQNLGLYLELIAAPISLRVRTGTPSSRMQGLVQVSDVVDLAAIQTVTMNNITICITKLEHKLPSLIRRKIRLSN